VLAIPAGNWRELGEALAEAVAAQLGGGVIA
jgi:hypothetical protein